MKERQSNFHSDLQWVLDWEGRKFEDVPGDPGGATCFGIIQSEYDAWRRRHGLERQSVARITIEEMEQIYRANYWNACHCDSLQDPLALAMFDTAVNLGPSRAIKWAQQSVGAKVDGVIGPQTMELVTKADYAHVVRFLAQIRIGFRHHRVEESPSQEKFLHGWLNRDNAVLNLVAPQA